MVLAIDKRHASNLKLNPLVASLSDNGNEMLDANFVQTSHTSRDTPCMQIQKGSYDTMANTMPAIFVDNIGSKKNAFQVDGDCASGRIKNSTCELRCDRDNFVKDQVVVIPVEQIRGEHQVERHKLAQVVFHLELDHPYSR